MSLFSGNALWHLVTQSDGITKFILILLLCLSVICWSIFIYKYLLFRIKKNHLQKALVRLQNSDSLEQLLQVASSMSGTLPGYFLSKNTGYLKTVLERARLSGNKDKHWDMMNSRIDQELDEILGHEESYLPFLSTTAAVAPLLGLFGTVWGLVHSFLRISERQSADIITVAPGIAEAFITTLVGLMVAVPALVMYNILAVQIRRMEQMLIKIADKMGTVSYHLFV